MEFLFDNGLDPNREMALEMQDRCGARNHITVSSFILHHVREELEDGDFKKKYGEFIDFLKIRGANISASEVIGSDGLKPSHEERSLAADCLTPKTNPRERRAAALKDLNIGRETAI